ncbi:Protein pelota -like protein [Echinococcus granulosus]|uniref:Protein pelota homolog n=1 Tax=Echinococcus granulosus TaxID=6210 RepID=U6J3X5_ECHGR|nr:Protein pelota [Echinococcus granulosus]EUB58449.1 Protein pelota [Echinococcus granulosus]KAH9286912.1 Protein pelota -like protein [Echinococcus granulosus]CDS16367.1 protein pelota [Echinococcus granulosus]
MRVLNKSIHKYLSGTISMIAENEEDMWLVYNLVQVGDRVCCSTMRKVQTENATGSVTSKTVRTNLTIEIETIDFDTHGSVLHLKGKNVVENQHVKMGAYHTLQIGVQEKFTLYKESWDTVSLLLVDQAGDPTQQADLAAVVMHEGLAYVCLITKTTTHVRAKIESTIPRKRANMPTSPHDKAIARFFDQIVQAIERHVRFDVVKCVIVASPGFLKDHFFEYLCQQALRGAEDKRIFLDNKRKFVLVHSSSGHKHALKEVLADPVVVSRIANTKAAGETAALNDFYQMLKVNPSRAFYGVKHVQAAVDSFAVETLLISDALFRSRDLAERKKFVAIVDSVTKNMGNVRIFSSLNVSGEQLNQLSGIAAVLRFPVAEPQSDDEDDEDDSDDGEMVTA